MSPKRIDDRAPYAPWPEIRPIAVAFQALSNGEASPEQQKIALKFLIEEGCRTYDMTWFPGEDGERMSSFASGRRFVGQQLVRQIKLKVGQIKE